MYEVLKTRKEETLSLTQEVLVALANILESGAMKAVIAIAVSRKGSSQKRIFFGLFDPLYPSTASKTFL